MDYVGSTTPLITNGGDPLSDELIKAGAAFRVDESDENSIRNVINSLVGDKAQLNTASAQMQKLQPKYFGKM